MKLSIRMQILAPMVVTIIVGFGSAFLIGYQAILGQTQVAAVVQQAVNAKIASAHIEQQFKEATSVVDRVLSMTNFVPAAEIKAGFEESNGALVQSLDKLGSVDLAGSLTEASGRSARPMMPGKRTSGSVSGCSKRTKSRRLRSWRARSRRSLPALPPSTRSSTK